MNVSVGPRWDAYIEELLKAGRYGSASEIVREGLRLVEEREERLAALRETIAASIEQGGSRTGEEVMATVRESLTRFSPASSGKPAA